MNAPKKIMKDTGYDITVHNLSLSLNSVITTYAKGYSICSYGDLSVKIWDHELYVYGINYGKVEKSVSIMLKKETIVIDGIEKKLVYE